MTKLSQPGRRPLRWMVGLGAVLGLAAAGRAIGTLDPGPVDRPLSAHFDGERFFNPWAPDTGNAGFRAFLRWQRTRQPEPWPDRVAITPARPAARIDDGRIEATMVGHATVLVQTRGRNILTDPIWSERASPFAFAGPRRVTAPGIPFDDLPPIDIVLVSHGHWDHLDVPTLRRLWARDRPAILVPLGHARLLARHGVPAIERDWGERVDLGRGWAAVAEPVQHWSSRWIIDRNRALWAGWSLVMPDNAGTLYFAGDTGLGDGHFFRAVARHGPVRLALLPVGAYEPRWFMAAQHMNPADAVAAMEAMGAERALGLHWGTFQLTDEGWDAPRRELAQALARAGIAADRFPALLAGETMAIAKPLPAPLEAVP